MPGVPASRGKLPLLLAIAVGLLAAGGAAFWYRNALFERWHLHMLHSKDPADWPVAAERLGELRSARAVPRLVEILQIVHHEIPGGPRRTISRSRRSRRL